VTVRSADEAEIDPLAQLWYDGWQDAHARIVPTELARSRTLPSFRERLRAALSSVRVVGPAGRPLGFCMVQADELDQLYVVAPARGTGVATALLADGEARIAASGAETAWLACAIGNERAARFYEKSGWRRAGTMVHELPVVEGTFRLEVWRYEKDVRRAASPAGSGGRYPLHAIGIIRSPLTTRGDAPRQGSEGAPDAWVEIEPAFAEALAGVAAGDDVILITWLHLGRRDVLRQQDGSQGAGGAGRRRRAGADELGQRHVHQAPRHVQEGGQAVAAGVHMGDGGR
jgi:GNAT superfamily N-acetyltransferase